ncbi:hypothetical protein HDU87_003369 [Geranomyces variabilis]|uniref:Poly(A) RNA polymerase mitochondrial-like central palm domain-containing protein n=1 Tax=Geranomyces variabilis TaxID=109894 RepID=A0AAD5XQN2_9FUNG|nr:hypothetical protein HDU87_003369 [Geranomyces variabilis]
MTNKRKQPHQTQAPQQGQQTQSNNAALESASTTRAAKKQRQQKQPKQPKKPKQPAETKVPDIDNYQLSIYYPAWVPAQKVYKGDLEKRLSDEIKDFVAFITLSDSEVEKRNKIVKKIDDAVRKHVPGAYVELFGSGRTTLALKNSDLDMVIFDPTPSELTVQKQLRKWINPLRSYLTRAMVIGARVPIMQAKADGVSVDISLNQSGGLSSFEVIRRLMAEYPQLRPLVVLLKHFLRIRDLNSAASSSLGSYAITLWVASFLKVHALMMPRRYESGDVKLGTVFLDFLKTFGEGGSFDFDAMGLDAGNNEEPICDNPAGSV